MAVSTAPVILLADGTRIDFDVLEREEPVRAVEVTAHPVERGADVSDHARLRNAETSWSVAVGADRAEDVLTRLRSLLATPQQVTLATTRETFRDMMITELRYPRSRETGTALRASLKAVEVRFVEIARRRIKITRTLRAKGSVFRGAVATTTTTASERQKSILGRLGAGEPSNATFSALDRWTGVSSAR